MKADKAYEILTRRLLAHLMPNAKVEHDVKVIGKSGQPRQIDVLVSAPIGPFMLKGIVDAKLTKRKLPEGAIDAFIGLLDDMQCNFGIIVSKNGFTKGALTRAAAEGSRVLPCSAFELEDPRFRLRLPIEVVASIAETGGKSKVRVTPLVQGMLDPVVFRDGGETLTLRDVIDREVVRRNLSLADGDNYLVCTGPYDVIGSGGATSAEKIEIIFPARVSYRIGNLLAVEGSGLLDANGTLIAGEIGAAFTTEEVAAWPIISKQEAEKFGPQQLVLKLDHFSPSRAV